MLLVTNLDRVCIYTPVLGTWRVNSPQGNRALQFPRHQQRACAEHTKALRLRLAPLFAWRKPGRLLPLAEKEENELSVEQELQLGLIIVPSAPCT